ncbi:cation-transporting P-type ATPase [Methanococcoides vulcani]|uniref:cation-transporting P-type ATPase n=1 Tax=Methanococcoides vulcani TaxID=1353158 RepID=UPI003184577B
MSLEEFLKRFDADTEGLTSAEALERLEICGKNILENIGRESTLKKYLKQFRNFFSILLITGALLSYTAELLDPGKGNLYIAIALFGVVILNATFTFIQEYQTEQNGEFPPAYTSCCQGSEGWKN